MTRIEATAALLAKIEAGPLWPADSICEPVEISRLIEEIWPDDEGEFSSAYDGSVDAAIALIEAEEANYAWGRDWGGQMWIERRGMPGYYDRYFSPKGMEGQPARALVICLLRAMIGSKQ